MYQEYKKVYEEQCNTLYIDSLFNADSALNDVLTQKAVRGGYNSLSRSLLSYIGEKMGGLNAKHGYFYETRIGILAKIFSKIEHKNDITDISILKLSEKNVNFLLPLSTMKLINEISRLCTREGCLDIHIYMQQILDSLKAEIEKPISQRTVEERIHDIDCLMCVTYKSEPYYYLVESKTKCITQDKILKGNVAYVLETWACILYTSIMNGLLNITEITINTLNILYLINSINLKSKSCPKYFSKFDMKNPISSGLIYSKEFYRFFFEIDILKIEDIEYKVEDTLVLKAVKRYVDSLVIEGENYGVIDKG